MLAVAIPHMIVLASISDVLQYEWYHNSVRA